MSYLNNKKLSIIYILEILKEYSDENHALTQNEILKKLYSIYGMECERKSVGANIDSLIEAGYEIVKCESGGCYLAAREFEQSEISFLVDAVFSSKSIDSKKSRDLEKKISAFSSVYSRKKYNYIYKSDEISRTLNKQLFFTIDILHDAIEQKKQVEFYYDRPYVSKENKEKQQSKKYIVNPYFLVNNQGRYYLVCNYHCFDDIANYKLDQIKDIKILETDAKPIEKVKGFEKGLNIAKYANENIYMFSADSVDATVKLSDEYSVGIVTDWFGQNAKIYQKNSEIFADITANEKALIYWALQYGEHFELLSPENTREKIKTAIENLKKKYF
ncbi:MAG: WYL domain-containing protein [Clostridia bacterium]|nr:WYL domain-containing protein [Clostridia bacterium]